MSGVIQSNSGSLSTAQASLSVALTNPVTAGNAIVAIVTIGNSRTLTNVKDNVNNTNFTVGISGLLGARAGAITYFLSSAGGTMTVTATFGGGTTSTAMLWVYEVTANAVDGSGSTGNAASGSALSSGGLATGNANDILFGVGFTGAASISAATSGWTSSIITNAASEYLVVSATGSYTATFTGSGSNGWFACIFALKLITVTPPPTPSGFPLPTYLQGTPFISTLRIALLDVWERWPHRLIEDINGNFYTAKQLLNNQNLGTKALMEVMVEYAPELGTIVWVSNGVRVATLYQVQGQGVSAPGGVGI